MPNNHSKEILFLGNIKKKCSINDVTEEDNKYSNNCICDNFFGLFRFFLIASTSQNKKTCIHNHNYCHKSDKAIQKDNNLHGSSQKNTCIKNTICTLCRYSEELTSSAVTSSVCHSDNWLSNQHNDEAYGGCDKYTFSFLKTLFISTGKYDSIKSVHNCYKETNSSYVSQEI